MLKVEDILGGHDPFSYIFRESLIKIGQVSTDSLFSFSQLSSMRGEILSKVMLPLLQFSQCHIRIKNYSKLSFNLIFIVKEPTLRGVWRIMEKENSRFSDLQVVDVHKPNQYVKEIDQGNIKAIMEFLKTQDQLITPDDLLEQLETAFKKSRPFSHSQIQQNYSEILDELVPKWRNYFHMLFTAGKQHIEKERIEIEKKHSFYEEIILKKGIFFDKQQGFLPTYQGFALQLYKALQGETTETIDKKDLEKYLVDKDKFFIFKAKITESKTFNVFGDFQGSSYGLTLDTQNNLSITENGLPLQNISDEKIQFILKTARKFFVSDVNISFHLTKSPGTKIYTIYLKKIPDILEHILQDKNVTYLSVFSLLFEKNQLPNFKKVYEKPVNNLMNLLIEEKVDSLVYKYINKMNKEMNFFTKLVNNIFSPWKEKNFKEQVEYKKAQINNITRSVISKGHKANPYTPIDAAINMIKAKPKYMQIREILHNPKNDLPSIVNQVFKLYPDVGATHKAVIMKSEALQKELVTKLNIMVNS